MSDCGLNTVVPLAPIQTNGSHDARPNHGLDVEQDWPAARLGVTMDRFELQAQAIPANFFRFNHTSARLPAKLGAGKSIAFAVPPGHHTHGALKGSTIASFSCLPAALKFQALAVAPKSADFVGTFVLSKAGTIELLREADDLEAGQNELPAPLKSQYELAKVAKVTPPKPFLCRA